MIVVPQIKNLTFTTSTWFGACNPQFSSTWSTSYKAGGVTVLLVQDTLTLNGWVSVPAYNVSILDPEYSGYNYRPYIPSQCSGQQKDHVPVSQGSGAYIIIAKHIVLGDNASICTYQGDGVGDHFGGGANLYGGGYCGGFYTNGEDYSMRTGGYAGAAGKTNTTSDGGPWPATKNTKEYSNTGMPASNAGTYNGFAGLSLMLVADTMTGFSIKKINTGGRGDLDGASKHAGSGYGASDGGGGSGTCFIYCNNLVSPDYTGVVI